MERELQRDGGEQTELTPETSKLVEEIKENARRDRRRVEELLDKLRVQSNVEVQPEIAVALAENLSDLTDSLTRSNAQLVELVKIESRARRSDGKMIDSDGIYEDITQERSADGWDKQ